MWYLSMVVDINKIETKVACCYWFHRMTLETVTESKERCLWLCLRANNAHAHGVLQYDNGVLIMYQLQCVSKREYNAMNGMGDILCAYALFVLLYVHSLESNNVTKLPFLSKSLQVFFSISFICCLMRGYENEANIIFYKQNPSPPGDKNVPVGLVLVWIIISA